MSTTADTLEAARTATWNDYMQSGNHDATRDRATVYSATAAASDMYHALEETETARDRFDALLDVRETLLYLLEQIEPITTEAREQAGRDDDEPEDEPEA